MFPSSIRKLAKRIALQAGLSELTLTVALNLNKNHVKNLTQNHEK